MFLRCPGRVELMLSLNCVNPEISMGHTLLVLRRIKNFYTTTLSNARSKWEVMHWRSGVDLELCVHAHRHDVDIIMEASLIIKCSLGISSSCIFKLILCNCGFDHIFSLITFPEQVKNNCLLQIISSVQPLFWSTSSIAPCYLDDIVSLHYLLWILIDTPSHHS